MLIIPLLNDLTCCSCELSVTYISINPFFTCMQNGSTLSELYELLCTDFVFVIDNWTLHKQLINMFIA